MSTAAPATPALIVVADDLGYTPAYDEGIAAAAQAGAIDAASAMVGRDPDPATLDGTGVEVGLHLELDGAADPAAEAAAQLVAFERRFGQRPSHIDGHRHCHAASHEVAVTVARLAGDEGIPVRSVSAAHRRLLRELGVATPDLLLGRLAEGEPALPAELAAWLEGTAPRRAGGEPLRAVEWMVHPGHAGGPSGYDRGRAEDLALLLELGDRDAWRRRGVRRLGPGAAL